MEAVTIAVMPRDKFSTMETCLDRIVEHTEVPYDLWVLSGGTPPDLERRWQARYGARARFTFFPEFRNGAELRNHVFEHVETRLVVFVDSDVYVRPDWLGPLVRCQQETGAALVSPLILDRDDRVHTAGTDLFVVQADGKSYASMELRYQHLAVKGRTNLERSEEAFGEMHCQLFLAEVGREIQLFDPALREFQEMDCGLTLARHGHTLMFEPASVVYLYYEQKLREPQDICFHQWKWDMAAMYAGFAHFEQKWGLDINPDDSFGNYLRAVNARVGFFSRRWPTKLSTFLDRASGRARRWSWAGP